MKNPRLRLHLAAALFSAALAAFAMPASALVCLPIDRSYKNCDDACKWEAWLPLSYPVCM